MREHDALQVPGGNAVDVSAPVDYGVTRTHERVHKLLPILPPHDAQSQQLLAVALLAQRVLRCTHTGGGTREGLRGKNSFVENKTPAIRLCTLPQQEVGKTPDIAVERHKTPTNASGQ